MSQILTLTWRQANVTVEKPDGSKTDYTRHRAYVAGTNVSLRDRRGLELSTIEAVKVETVDRKTYRFTSADGEIWTVAKAGCGCGGR